MSKDFFRISLEIFNRSYPLLLVLFLFLLSSDVSTDELSTAPDVAASLPYTQSEFNSNETSLDLIDTKRSKKLPTISIEDILGLGSRAAMEKTLSEAIPLLLESQAFDFVSECESIADLDMRALFLRAIFAHLTKIDIRRTLHRFDALSPDDQVSVIESIYENVEVDDERYAIQSLAEFSWDVQQIALLAFFSDSSYVSSEQLQEIAELVPAFAVPFIAELRDRETRKETALRLVQHWAEEDVQFATRLIKDLHRISPDEHLLEQTTIALAQTHPREAFEITHDFYREFGFLFEQEIFNRIAEEDSELAKDLLPYLRAGYPVDSRVSRLDLVSTILDLDPVHAVQFGNSLFGFESTNFFGKLLRAYCVYEVKPLGIEFHSMSRAEIVSRGSKCVLLSLRRREKLNENQFQILYSHLIAKDRERVDEFPRSYFIQTHRE